MPLPSVAVLAAAFLLGAPARAQDVTVAPEPIPVAGKPVPVQATAYLLPAQDPAWLTDEARFRTCTVQVTWAPEAPAEVSVPGCPQPFGDAMAAATRSWEFRTAERGESSLTKFQVVWVLRYEERLGFMTLHAEVDPGREAAFEGRSGPPGVKLVHPAEVDREVRAKMPRKVRRKGVDKGPCQGRVEVAPDGLADRVEWESCPDALRESAGKALSKWRFSPRVVDGVTDTDVVSVQVVFK